MLQEDGGNHHGNELDRGDRLKRGSVNGAASKDVWSTVVAEVLFANNIKAAASMKVVSVEAAAPRDARK